MAVVNAMSYMRLMQLQKVLISSLIRPCMAKGKGHINMVLYLKGVCIHSYSPSCSPPPRVSVFLSVRMCRVKLNVLKHEPYMLNRKPVVLLLHSWTNWLIPD